MQTTLPISLSAISVSRPRTFSGRAILAVSATAFVAVCAHISLPLYFTPVPLTLQTFAVLLVGLLLGPTLGFSALALYLAEGAVGMPVFSPHGPGGLAQLMGPTAGYLLSYPLAAAAAGAIASVFKARSRVSAAVIAGIATSVIILALGAGWLSHILHLAPAAAWHLAIAPFLPGEVLKIAAAAGIFSAFTARQAS